MCEMCLQTPCDPRCPNAPELKEVHICVKCFEGIYSGEKCFNGPDGYICERCIDDMTSKELLEMLGESLEEA